MNWETHYVRKCLCKGSIKYGDGIHCVYYWQENKTGKIFYVGSGKCYRFNDVNPKSRTVEFMEYINNYDCSPKIVSYGMEKQDAVALEMKLIAEFWAKGCPLTNKQGVEEREKAYRKFGYEKFRARRLALQ